MAFWSCEPELSICSFLIYATQTLTPSDKGQALLLVWCSKMTAQGKVCPWRNSRNLCSEPPWATRQLDSAQRSRSEVFKCINKKIRARAPYAGEKKIPSYLGDKFRKMLNFFFFFFSDSEEYKGSRTPSYSKLLNHQGKKTYIYP